jgi:hypothetical protein
VEFPHFSNIGEQRYLSCSRWVLSSSGLEADDNIRLGAEPKQEFSSTFLFAFLIIYQHFKTIPYKILGKVQK